ncbi:TPA: reductive dehalogenase [Candidatus Poribacteria bacterium]|nr:reductive dehalogenase [Candidatus Poribacteria bacterium]
MRIGELEIKRLVENLGTFRVLEKENLSRYVRRSLNVEEVSPDDLPYKVDEDRFTLFSVRNRIFNRANWDPPVAEMRRLMGENRRRNIEGKRGGFTLADYALEGAAWMFSGAHGREEDESLPEDAIVEVRDELLTRLIKRAALFLGADLVGVTEVDSRWFYLETAERLKGYRYVLVLAFEMDLRAMEMANEGTYGAEVGLGYSRMSVVSAQLARFLRGLGFKALAQGNEGSLSIPYAVMAGLGEQGRSGLLITPEYGSRVRLAKVFTDAPLLTDKPIRFGVWEFCWRCQICADACTEMAITHGGPSWDGPTISEQRGVFKWHVDHERCYALWAAEGRGCGLCIKVCPYSRESRESQRAEALIRARHA